MRSDNPLPDERLLSLLIEHSTDMIAIVDSEGVIRYESPSVERVLGWRPDEIVGRCMLDLLHPDDRDATQQVFIGSLGSPGVLPPHEFRALHKDGSFRHIEAVANNLLMAPEVTGIVINSRDVTDRKLAEEAHHRTLQMLQAVVSSSPVALVAMTPEGIVTSWNPAAERMFGWTKEEAIGRFYPIVLPEQEDEHRGLRERVIETGGYSDVSLTRWHKDGRSVPVSLSAAPIRDEAGRVTGVLAVLSDLSDVRRTEQALRESEELTARLVESAQEGIWFIDADDRTTLANPKMAEMLGVTVADVMGRRPHDFVRPCDRPLLEAALDCHREGRPSQFDLRLVRADGAMVVCRVASNPITDADGRYMGALGMFADITERAESEQALRASEERYRLLAEAIPQLVTMTDARGEMTLCNRRWIEYTGLTLADGAAGWAKVNHPDDNERTAAAWHAALEAGEPYEVEYRLRRASDGAYRWHLSHTVPLRDAEGRIVQWLGVHTDIHNHRMAEEALRSRDDQLRALFASGMFGILLGKADGTILEANEAFLDMVGYSRTDLEAGRLNWRRLTPARWDAAQEQALREVAATGSSRPYEKEMVCRDGTILPVLVGVATVDAREGVMAAYLLNLTERKRLEEQLLQAQKMEGIGRLAGGVAHDFNNLLTAILGCTELAEDMIAGEHPARQWLSSAREAGSRAADLTRQLLAFARKQVVQPQIVHLDETVANLSKLLRRLIGEDVTLTTSAAKDLGVVRVDPGQMQQVLVNLAVNARDAMPRGGQLTIETLNATVAEGAPVPDPEMPAGDYVCVRVRDTGSGMTDEVKARLFEPFFTTKEQGKGTGLGLATCYGIVKQSGGYITVESAPGRGSTFAVYLPAAREEEAAPAGAATVDALPHGVESVLLVEDEPMVRGIAVQTLRALGYSVIEAADGVEALRLLRTGTTAIQLLVSDVVMPRMGGPELARQLRAERPTLKVLLTSGYTDGAIVPDAEGVTDGSGYLQKPFTPESLARKVREVLDAP